MNPFTCLICGETYLGGAAPDRCPFCGAHKMYLLPSSVYMDQGRGELSEQSRKDCRKALQFKLKNQSFYLCAAENAENPVTEKIFKRLAKQEAEHAELLCEIMGIEETELPRETCESGDVTNFKEVNGRERRAINFCHQVAARAPEARVKEVFRAIAEIECEHLKLSKIYGSIYGGICEGMERK